MLRSALRSLTFALAGGFVCQLSVCAVEDLPGENRLPQKSPPILSLPGENLLPQQAARRPANLPGENVLPVARAADQPREIGREPHGRPWLRLNLPGHSGTIRSITFTRDSQRLCSGGDDKIVNVWVPTPAPQATPQTWVHARTIRWQIQRGSRGRIYALAAGQGLLALAGHGAMGGLGEILLVDPATGALNRSLVDTEHGHRQVVESLSFSTSGNRLVSMDLQGKVVLWQRDLATGQWTSTELVEADAVTYGAPTARRLEPARRFARLVMSGDDRVIVPKFSGFRRDQPSSSDVPQWELEQINVTTGERRRLSAKIPHQQMVTALAASADGQRLVSADAYGYLYVWNLRGVATPIRLQQNAAVVSAAFAADSRTFLVGTADSSRLEGKAVVQLWNAAQPQEPTKIHELRVAKPVYSCALSPDGKKLAYSQGSAVFFGDVTDPSLPPQKSAVPIQPPLQVAFARERPFYRLAVATKPSANAYADFSRVFDAQRLQLDVATRVDQSQWMRPTWYAGNWSIRRISEGGASQSYLFRGEKRQARLPLEPQFHGKATTWCWIPGGIGGQPQAVAVGTNGNNNIYVFSLAEQGDCPTLRVFRGHGGEVTSLGISRDLRYLVSGSTDATVRIWKIQGIAQDSVLANRWGGEFAVQDDALLVTSLREDGPLYFRGIRAGDQIRFVKWTEDGAQIHSASKPVEVVDALSQVPWDTLVEFGYERRGQVQPGFQMFPAWQQIASLILADNREWAYWTPAGYYDASFEGHKLFGWQIDPEGLDQMPEFFLAAQFRKALERPRVMSRLLEAGSLEAAHRSVQLEPPPNSQQAVVEQYLLKPRVKIVSPVAEEVVEGDVLTIRAEIAVRKGMQLVAPKAFANGVVAPSPRITEEQPIAGGRLVHYQWEAHLPSDPVIQVQVVAATDAEVTDIQQVAIRRRSLGVRVRPRLFVLACGINDYRDAQIPRLDYAVSNANRLVAALKEGSSQLYTSQVTALLNRNVEPLMWRIVAEQYARDLKQRVSPDDLLLVFLSGHGVRDAATQNYYYITAAARYADVKSGRFADCMSFEDFSLFADIPCRKLVVLDTCHSGAVQPVGQQQLKSAIRALQDDWVFTLTASEGGEEAVESQQRQLGRFTARLLEALGGAADAAVHGGDQDGVVTLNETIQYVQQLVPQDAAADETGQHPTAGPAELLPYVRLPLTSRRNLANAGAVARPVASPAAGTR